MEVKTGSFDIEEFVTKVVEPEVSPTVLLLEWQPGFVIGGLDGVPRPKGENQGFDLHWARDPEKKSFILSLEPKAQRFDLLDASARRFDLVDSEKALSTWSHLLARSNRAGLRPDGR
jgi:hypothetical protein